VRRQGVQKRPGLVTCTAVGSTIADQHRVAHDQPTTTWRDIAEADDSSAADQQRLPVVRAVAAGFGADPDLRGAPLGLTLSAHWTLRGAATSDSKGSREQGLAPEI
jgi:hypothetical protein